MPHQIEALLFWGRSRRMEQYERKVKEIKKHKKLEADTPIIRDIEKRVALLRDIQRGDAMPRFPNLKRIEANYLAARQDMLSKGLTPERCLKKIPDGWVMGCPNDYWQTLVLYAICTINHDFIRVPFLADYLKSKHGIDTIEPARFLTLHSAALANLEYSGTAVPNSYSMLSQYLNHLVEHRVLSKGRGGEYKKRAPYGKAYRKLTAR